MFSINSIKQAVEAAGLQLVQKSRGHWQVIGGIAIVNIHRSNAGYSMYVQGMAKGKHLDSPSKVVVAATQFVASNKRITRKSTKGVRHRKWNQAIRNGWNPSCHWCGHAFEKFEDATADHVVPLSKGGGNGDDNFVLACNDCNVRRRNNVTNADVLSVNTQKSQEW